MADSKPVIPLQLEGADVLLKRVASNFERHGEEFVPVLDITWETMVPPATLVGLLGEYCDRVLFNTTKGGVLEPSEVFKRSALPIAIEQDLVAQFVGFTLSDNIEREFGEEPDEGEEAAPSQICPITKLGYDPRYGGGVWLGGCVRIRPRDALEHWAFLEHQGRHAKLTIADSAIKVGNGKQQQLPLTQPGEGFAAGAAARANGPAPSEHLAPTKQAEPESATPVSSGEGDGDAIAAPSAAGVQNDDQKFDDDIGPKTRAELERVKNRRGRRPIDGRSSH